MDLKTIKILLRYPRGSVEFLAGVDGFLEFAYQDKLEDTKIYCPCETCVHTMLLSRNDVYDHLVCNGMLQSYDQWDFHRESSEEQIRNQQPQPHNEDMRANMHELINDALRTVYDDMPMSDSVDSPCSHTDGPNLEAQAFYKLVKASEKPLWDGCELSHLSLLVLLFNMKAMNKWSDKSFGDLLDILHMAIPNGKELPKNFYEAKKVVSKFGLDYQHIHACPNNCQLFWNIFKNKSKMPQDMARSRRRYIVQSNEEYLSEEQTEEENILQQLTTPSEQETVCDDSGEGNEVTNDDVDIDVGEGNEDTNVDINV